MSEMNEPGMKELDDALTIVVAFIENTRARLITLERRVEAVESQHGQEWQITKGDDL